MPRHSHTTLLVEFNFASLRMRREYISNGLMDAPEILASIDSQHFQLVLQLVLDHHCLEPVYAKTFMFCNFSVIIT